MRPHGQCLFNLATAQDLQPIVLELANDPGFKKLLRADLSVETGQITDVDNGVGSLEDVGEAALREAAVQRHLPTLESGVVLSAGAGVLPFVAPARGLAMPGARTTADPLGAATRDPGAGFRWARSIFGDAIYASTIRTRCVMAADHAADCRIIGTDDLLIHAPQTERFQGPSCAGNYSRFRFSPAGW